MKAHTFITTTILLITTNLEAQQIVEPQVHKDLLSFSFNQEDSLLTMLPKSLPLPKIQLQDNCTYLKMPIFNPSKDTRDDMPQLQGPDLKFSMPLLKPDSSCFDLVKTLK